MDVSQQEKIPLEDRVCGIRIPEGISYVGRGFPTTQIDDQEMRPAQSMFINQALF